MNPYFAYLASVIAAGITWALCIYAKPICTSLGILDIPDARKTHAQPTPLMGGLALQFAVLPIMVIVALFVVPTHWSQPVIIVTAAVGAMTLVGLADDRHTLTARDRLLASFLVFISAAIIDPSTFNVRLLDFEHPAFHLGLGTGWLAVLFTALCCVGLVNAVNMADGKNGLVIGLSLGWLSLLAMRAPAELWSIIGVAGATLLVLFVFNLRGKLFLGDGGAYGIATLIGLLAISIYNTAGSHAGRSISADELMVLFYAPVLDSFRLTITRVREGRSPMSADRNHLHHHLQNRFGWPGGLFIYLMLAIGVPALWMQL